MSHAQPQMEGAPSAGIHHCQRDDAAYHTVQRNHFPSNTTNTRPTTAHVWQLHHVTVLAFDSITRSLDIPGPLWD